MNSLHKTKTMKTATLVFHTFVASVLHKLSVYPDTTTDTHLDFSHCRGNPSVYDLKESEEVKKLCLVGFFWAQQQNSMTAKLFVDNSTNAGETYMFLPTWVRAFTPQFI